MTDDAPSKHTTRQEIVKSPRSRCMQCGLIGVSSMVKANACVNVLACARRQRDNAKRAPAPAAPPTEAPKKAKAKA